MKQHKIPRVYLRQFGYHYNNQWKISVLQQCETFVRQKSIESFLAETNIFDVESNVHDTPRLFEEFNCDIENNYNNIISDLDTQGKLSK